MGEEITNPDNGKVEIKRTLGFFGVVATMVGGIIGSGIFISPKGVLVYTGSVGLNLIVWALCGLIILGGALCFAELGTLIPENGGQWAYLRIALGNVPAFLYAFYNTLTLPVEAALQSMAAAGYLLSPLYGACGVPEAVLKITGVLLTWLSLYITTSVSTTTRILKVLFVVKIGALLMVVIGGMYWMATRGTEGLQDPFKGTTDDVLGISTSFYFGLFPYSGWTTTNCLAEEVKDVHRTLPRAIVFSILFLIGLYMFVNLSYYSVLTTDQVLASDAVVFDWGLPIVGEWASLFSIAAGLSIIGALLVLFITMSRTVMALAREGHIFQALSLVHVKDNSPIVTILFCGAIAPIAVLTCDILSLIKFMGFLGWLFKCLTFISLVRLKWIKYRENKRDVFRVPIVLPIVMTLICACVVVVPVVTRPGWEYLYSSLIVLSGLLIYFPFMHFKNRCKIFDRVTVFMQVVFKVGIPDKNV